MSPVHGPTTLHIDLDGSAHVLWEQSRRPAGDAIASPTAGFSPLRWRPFGPVHHGIHGLQMRGH